ncbi:asparagine synthase (glutamine-hydrolyzing) [Clostridium butyricum]|uniref:asparagine synthase (glutamine-hydrolyzing) n=1 Tax=Clostridium butyricum TaxID=1492 RepID=UPI00374EB35B
MCGISGFVKKRNKEFDINKIIEDMTEIIDYRGPDGKGYYVNNNVALGHRRLSIIDLELRANQPFVTEKYILIFNGEIYNYKQLKKDMCQYNYKTESDTEVIIAAYEKFGQDCVKYFKGMWAFMLFDLERNIIFCSRDRFGIKPLYYYNKKDYIAFASEIKQFTVLPQWKAVGNCDRIQDFLVFGVLDHTDETMFNDVKQILPGNNIVYDLKSNRINIYEYYNLNKAICKNRNKKETQFKKLIKNSICEHMIADVSIGSCLSGGLDSSTIVMLMDEILKENKSKIKIETVSSCFNSKEYDEQEYIDIINDEVKANKHKVFPTIEELFENLHNIIWHQDEPFGSTSIFAQWNVFKEAKRNNIKVMLDGQGADEQLAGYNSFYIAYFNELFYKMNFLKLQDEISSLIDKYNYFTKEDIFQRAFKSQLCSLKDELKERLNRPDRFMKPCFEPYFKYYSDLNSSMKNIKDFSIHQIRHSSLPQLLHYEDRNSMTFSIESRVPFLDHELVEYILSCDSHKKINKGITKIMLRDEMKNILPEKIRMRKDKMGFVTPEVEWIRENKEIFRVIFENGCDRLKAMINKDMALSWFDDQMKSTKKFDFTIWRIICLGKWMDIFKVSEIT